MSQGDNSNSYRSIAKGTAMMGGVQVFNILINVIRGKLVAMFLGPGGMGISSLLGSAIAPIQQLSSLGLSLSTVKDVAELKDKVAQEKISHISLIRTLYILTALIGAIIVIILSPQLSKWTFGDISYRWHFVALSLMLVFKTLSNGELAILQGSHAMKRLAYSSLVGSGAGLVIGVPLYYFFGKEGIVPAMILLPIVSFVFYRYHESKLFESKIICSFSNIKNYSPLIKSLISLGMISMISALLGTLCNYAVNAIIRYSGGIDDVGLFQAANSITSQYVALVFSAMSMDYFPRLAAVNSDNKKVISLVNSQAEIVLLVIAPIISLVICFTPMLIELLLTNEFIVLKPIIRIFAFSVLFKAIAYPMGYISFAKGDKKTFFWLEGIYGNVVLTLTSILGYFCCGLQGLAMAAVITYIIIVLSYLYVTRRLYSYKMSGTVVKLLFVTGSVIVACFACSFIKNVTYSYISMGFFTLLSSIISILGLEKRIKISEIIKRKLLE